MRIFCPNLCVPSKCTKVKKTSVPKLVEKNPFSMKNVTDESDKKKQELENDRKISIDQYSHYFIDEYASGELHYYLGMNFLSTFVSERGLARRY